MRIGILALQHESNTFITAPTPWSDFVAGGVMSADALASHYGPSHHEVGGFLAGLADADVEAVPLFAAWALPSGAIAADACDRLLGMMADAVDRAGAIDGWLVAAHGAAVAVNHPDLDGHWLTWLRRRIGPDVPVACTLDPHANLSARMVAACDATIAYRTNPHLDQRQRGLEAAALLVDTLRGRVRPTQAAALPPIAINIEKQETSAAHCRPLYGLAEAMRGRPGVLSASILLGFPYADVAEMGSATVVVTDDDAPLARRLADELGGCLWDHRQSFVAELTGIEAALDAAERADGPVCLLDMGDNVGGGSTADGTFIAHAIHRRGGPRSFVALFDPESVEAAAAAGVGATSALRVGGRTDDRHGAPLAARFTVRSLHDGRFNEPEARHGGRVAYDMGRTAIVETDTNLTVQLTSKRMPPFSLHQVKCCDLDPAAFRILVAKGVNAPIAAYAEVCNTFIRVNTPGSTTADMDQLAYHHRRRPLFPFEREAEWAVRDA